MQIKRKLKEEKGSIAAYVTIVLLSFFLILSSIYFSSTSVRKSQLITALKVKESYEANNNDIEEVYQTQLKKIEQIRQASEANQISSIAETSNEDETDNNTENDNNTEKNNNIETSNNINNIEVDKSTETTNSIETNNEIENVNNIE